MSPVAAFVLGFLSCWLLVRWGAMWRACCQAHYRTHETCACADCRRDRRAA